MEELRHKLTDDQFVAYVQEEGYAQAMEVHLSAVGTAHAIAHALGKGDALKTLARSLGLNKGPVTGGGGSEFMQELRRRVASAMDLKTPRWKLNQEARERAGAPQ